MLLGGILILFLCIFGVVVCQRQSENNEVTKKVKVSDDVLDCSTFDPKKIKLVTFDLFAALMDLDTSLQKNIAEILPTLTSKQVSSLASQWESAYSSYAGYVFDESITGPSPFQWVLTTSLTSILQSMNIQVTDEEFHALIAAWGNLIPWPGTQEVLEQVYNANFTIGALSNGDKGTLGAATSVFLPNVKFSYWFSSDFPVGSFKPDHAMYDQVLHGSGYAATEILHCAGASQDGWGARADGMYSALLRSPPLDQPPKPCFLLDDITDLPAVLGI